MGMVYLLIIYNIFLTTNLFNLKKLFFQEPVLIIVVHHPPKYLPTFLSELFEILTILIINHGRILLTSDCKFHVDKASDKKGH